jgi:IS5 family transposase
MNQFEKYPLNQAYEKIARLGDRLAKIDQAVYWESFRPIIRAMYTNNTHLGGRPNTDEVLMVKLLVLQQWIGLSDIELERQAADRISFQRFLGWPNQPPDYSTIWQFRERLASTMTDAVLWGGAAEAARRGPPQGEEGRRAGRIVHRGGSRPVVG